MDKRGNELSMGTIVTIVLALVVLLVILIIFFEPVRSFFLAMREQVRNALTFFNETSLT